MEILPRDTPADASRVPNILAAEIIVVVVSTLAVSLRIAGRLLRRVPLGGDDLTIVLALPMAWGIAISTFLMLHYGYGKHGSVLPKSDMKPFMQSLLAAQICWSITLPLIKVSICLFYRRIFGEIKYMRYATMIIAAYSIGWGIMYAIVLGLQCVPIASMWDKSIKGYQCIEQMLFCFIGSAMNAATDFILIALPLHAIWNLRMSTQEKLQVSGILALGTFASAVSLTRLALLLHWQRVVDPTWNYFYPHLFSTIEAHLGIASACLPTMRPIVQQAFSKARNSIGLSPRTPSDSDRERSHEKVVDSKSDGSKSRSATYSYQVVVTNPSKPSVHSGDERLLNPNDLSFWRSSGSETSLR